MLYIDIDKLQAINEAFGFTPATKSFSASATWSTAPPGAKCLASRIGGRPFVIAAAGGHGGAGAAEVGKEFSRRSSQLGYVNGTESVPVSVSIGVAAASAPRERLPHLLASAELACKRAKPKGRNRIATHEDLDRATLTATRQLIRRNHLRTR